MTIQLNPNGSRYFLPPLQPRGQNQQIRFPVNRNNNFQRRRNQNRNFPNTFRRPNRNFNQRRRPILRVMYGQQQDLAFQPKRNRTKGVGNTFTTPVSESKTIESFFKFNNDQITFCQPVPASFYILTQATVPVHPMFYFGRTANLALNFANFTITRAILHYVPLIGSTSPGMIAMGSTRNCTPISYDTTLAFAALTQISSEIHPVWMCSKFQIKDLDNTMKNMAPINRLDIPNNIYVVGNGIGQTMANSCTLFMEMTIKLSRPNPSPSLNPFAAVVQYILSANGVRSNTAITTNVHGIVTNSTATNIDVGEYIQCGATPVIATDYPDVIVTHNNAPVDYLNAPDQGTMYVMYFTEN